MQKSNSEKIKLEPLDPKKVESIVKKYENKHIRHKHGAVIFVGSGGGKSTVCRNQKPDSEGKTDLIDADLVYRETNAHPLQPGVYPLRPLPWWEMGDEIIHEVELRCGVVNQAMIDHGLWAMTTSFDPEDKYVPENIVIVLLPWEEHKRRIVEKSSSANYDAGAKANKAGFSIVMGHREWTKKVAKEKNIPVIDSIEKAINLVHSREEK
jgi:hypothetical protein